MASLAEKKQIDELLAKFRASAERDQRRVDELEEQRAHFGEAISSSLVIPASGFAASYVRAYYGDEASSICGIPIDAVVGVLLNGFAALLGFSPNKGAQTAAKLLHDIANGALASWTTGLGADFGAKKRMEKFLPTPQPNAGREGTLERAPRPMTYEEFDAIRKGMALQTKPAMPERQPALPLPHVPPSAPLPPRVQQNIAPPPAPEPAVAKASASAPVPQPPMPPLPLNGQPYPIASCAQFAAAPTVPPTPQRPYRFTQRWEVNPEADMRALLQSVGAPSDPNTVMHLLSHEKPGETFDAIVRRARAPA